jgi:hypothetical protein
MKNKQGFLVIIDKTGASTMSAVTFDTLQFVQRLTQAGVKEPQAVAIAEAVRDVQASAWTEIDVKFEESSGKQATKQDLSITEARIKQELSVTEAKLEAKIAETKVAIAETKGEIEKIKADLVKWVVSVGVLQFALIAALLLKLIPS